MLNLRNPIGIPTLSIPKCGLPQNRSGLFAEESSEPFSQSLAQWGALFADKSGDVNWLSSWITPISTYWCCYGFSESWIGLRQVRPHMGQWHVLNQGWTNWSKDWWQINLLNSSITYYLRLVNNYFCDVHHYQPGMIPYFSSTSRDPLPPEIESGQLIGRCQ